MINSLDRESSPAFVQRQTERGKSGNKLIDACSTLSFIENLHDKDEGYVLKKLSPGG